METSPEAIELLLAEIAAYLAVVEALRLSKLEPTWAPEHTTVEGRR
jgi:hypothetical protein